jgi:threonine dehydratase
LCYDFGMGKFQVTYEKILVAQAALSKYLSPSPLLYNAWLSDSLGCELYLKLENMQPIGSFKIRGATYKIACLTEKERASGVIAASAGNHAQGVAWGSKKLGVKATIVMPKNAPIVKVENTQSLGAEVILDGDTYDEAFHAALEIAKKTGKTFVHAFEDEAVICGQGTCALEIMDQLPDVDVVVGSIGGGGLMAGVATVIKKMRPTALVVGCQATGAPSMVRSLREGKAIRTGKPTTFADGIAVSEAREELREILAPLLDEAVEVDDEATAAAVLTLMEKAKTIAEGSGAISLAALEKVRFPLKGKKVVVIVSGGNIDVNVLSRIIDRGLIRAGRRLRVNVWLSDRPGSLARLTDLLARQGANILQAIHDRSEPSVTIDQTEVALTLETRGQDHSDEVLRVLKDQVLRMELVH